ncbi:MAG: hypothetical protein M1839_005606 [Geoglossum umbratile]|nr:MAG: hypothetical protein M1839_005606 [Geoglossum umbratile]
MGDEVRRIEGVFSGTMSLWFNSFAPVGGGGGKFSEDVKKAKDLGYTEPNPRDDLNGLDVARKLTILARLSNLPIKSPASFPVQSLIPKPLESVQSGHEFLAHLCEYDEDSEKLKKKQRRKGRSYVKESDNIISFYTKRYGSKPLIIQAAGVNRFSVQQVLVDRDGVCTDVVGYLMML